MKLVDELRQRASDYRQSGPSAEHTALLLEAAAAKIDHLEAIVEMEREEVRMYKIPGRR